MKSPLNLTLAAAFAAAALTLSACGESQPPPAQAPPAPPAVSSEAPSAGSQPAAPADAAAPGDAAAPADAGASGDPAAAGAAEGARVVRPMKVGMTVQDLSNQLWAGACDALDKLVVSNGGDFTYLDCKSNVSAQVGQIENFVASGVDIIVIQPAEANAVEAPLAAARAKGIKVYCWDEDIENADLSWLIDNYELGRMIGKAAAEWIKDKYDGKAEVAILDYPQLEILLKRGNGIADAITEYAPEATVVARDSAINPTEGMSKTETFLQGHPGIRVVAAIGGGGAIGANEAVKGSGKPVEEFGIFAADATPEELEAMKNNEAVRFSILITGTPKEIGAEIYRYLTLMYDGKPVDRKVYRELIPVTQDNYQNYIGK
ncbi:MAG: sugar ABC transporter substrate-binding protein [Deltaproteobacteria bacterium]|nr:sugar ABC transporter substrate-binding protein [Deltaproteobacteria bacterium]